MFQDNQQHSCYVGWSYCCSHDMRCLSQVPCSNKAATLLHKKPFMPASPVKLFAQASNNFWVLLRVSKDAVDLQVALTTLGRQGVMGLRRAGVPGGRKPSGTQGGGVGGAEASCRGLAITALQKVSLAALAISCEPSAGPLPTHRLFM